MTVARRPTLYLSVRRKHPGLWYARAVLPTSEGAVTFTAEVPQAVVRKYVEIGAEEDEIGSLFSSTLRRASKTLGRGVLDKALKHVSKTVLPLQAAKIAMDVARKAGGARPSPKLLRNMFTLASGVLTGSKEAKGALALLRQNARRDPLSALKLLTFRSLAPLLPRLRPVLGRAASVAQAALPLASNFVPGGQVLSLLQQLGPYLAQAQRLAQAAPPVGWEPPGQPYVWSEAPPVIVGASPGVYYASPNGVHAPTPYAYPASAVMVPQAPAPAALPAGPAPSDGEPIRFYRL